MKKFAAVIQWIFVGIFAICLFGTGLHFSSLFILAGIALMMPLPAIRERLVKVKIRGWLAILLAFVLFFVGVLSSPSTTPPDNDDLPPVYATTGSSTETSTTTMLAGSSDTENQSTDLTDTTTEKSVTTTEKVTSTKKSTTTKKSATTTSKKATTTRVTTTTKTTTTTKITTTTKATTTTKKPTTTAEASATYVLNTSTKKVHNPGCWTIKRILPENYAESDLSLDSLTAQGYDTCGHCFN